MAALWRDRAPGDWATLLAADPSASPAHRPEVWEAFAAAMPGCAAGSRSSSAKAGRWGVRP